MREVFRWLFSSENFIPHGHCYLWQPGILWLNVCSDALIAGSYLAIPLTILYFIRRRPSAIRYAWVPTMFAAFILLCGATHVMDIWTVWTPIYRVAGGLKLLTGVVSFATLASLIWIMPHALLLKTPRQLHEEVESRTTELIAINAQLRSEIAARDAAVRQLHVAEQERARADALLHTIIESAPSLIYAKDTEGRMLLANPPALALIGKSWQEVQGHTDLEFLEDKDQAGAILRNDRRLMEANHTEAFEEAVGTEGGDDRVWFSTKAPLRDGEGAVIGLVGVSVEITERKRLEYRLRLMVDELNHRVKNTLATVQAIATQTLRPASIEVYNAFQDRLLALARAHDTLTREGWTGAELDEVIAGQLAPYGGGNQERVEMSGPKLRLSARAALALAMGLHELATNALKHGALSNPVGRVLIHWEVTDEAEPQWRLTWRECDGPRVVPPTRRGFGSRLIERILLRDLGGTVRLDFSHAEGIRCVMESSLAELSAPASMLPFTEVGIAPWPAT